MFTCHDNQNLQLESNQRYFLDKTEHVKSTNMVIPQLILISESETVDLVNEI